MADSRQQQRLRRRKYASEKTSPQAENDRESNLGQECYSNENDCRKARESTLKFARKPANRLQSRCERVQR